MESEPRARQNDGSVSVMIQQGYESKKRVRIYIGLMVIVYVLSYLFNMRCAISDSNATFLGAVCSLFIIGLWGGLLVLQYRSTSIKLIRKFPYPYWILILIVSILMLILKVSDILLSPIIEVLGLFLPILVFALLTPFYGIRFFIGESVSIVTVLYTIWIIISVAIIISEYIVAKHRNI
jgi:hypothetical protein